jgi:hypothetical protein
MNALEFLILKSAKKGVKNLVFIVIVEYKYVLEFLYSNNLSSIRNTLNADSNALSKNFSSTKPFFSF